MNRITSTVAEREESLATHPTRSSLGGMMLAAFGILLLSLVVRALFG